MTLSTLRAEFDEAGPFNLAADENISINISTRTNNEIDLTVGNAFICVNNAGTFAYAQVMSGSVTSHSCASSVVLCNPQYTLRLGVLVTMCW